MDQIEKHYTVSQLAKESNLPKSSIYALINVGLLRAAARNNRTRFYTIREFNRAKEARLKSLNDEDRRGFMESQRGRATV